MSDRNWDAELKKIDRAMGAVPDEALLPAKGATAPQGRAGVTIPTGTSAVGVFARLALAVALGVAIAFWPYAARCGAGLAAYLGAVAVLIGAGTWSSIWTWRHRAPKAHALSLLILLWGLVLGSIEVLPRTGYAVPTAAHPAKWACS